MSVITEKLLKDNFLGTEIIYQLYELMEIVHKLFTTNNIYYWAVGGTLLGAVRDSSLIPWDDDLDIMILHTDYDKVKKLLESHFKDNLNYSVILYTWKPNVYGFKILIKSIGLKLDIFLGIEKNNKIIISEIFFPHDNFTKQELFPPKLYDFGKNKIYGIVNPINHLNKKYGTNWKTTAVVWNHRKTNNKKVGTFQINDDYHKFNKQI